MTRCRPRRNRDRPSRAPRLGGPKLDLGRPRKRLLRPRRECSVRFIDVRKRIENVGILDLHPARLGELEAVLAEVLEVAAVGLLLKRILETPPDAPLGILVQLAPGEAVEQTEEQRPPIHRTPEVEAHGKHALVVQPLDAVLPPAAARPERPHLDDSDAEGNDRGHGIALDPCEQRWERGRFGNGGCGGSTAGNRILAAHSDGSRAGTNWFGVNLPKTHFLVYVFWFA